MSTYGLIRISHLSHVTIPEAQQIVAATQVAERLAAGKAYKKALGIYCQQPSYGKKKIQGPNGPEWRWDEQQLAYIAEIAERLANDEPVVKVAEDFWRHQARDHRGLPWGKVEPKNGPTPKGSPYEHFRRAVRWFHREKHAGTLPPPWNEVAWTIKARWRREKANRLRSRVHQPMLMKLKTMSDGDERTQEILMIEKKSDQKRLLEIDNVHSGECGPPPSLDAKNKYVGYFENCFGEQGVFVGDRETGGAVVRGGDTEWATEYKVSVAKPCPRGLLLQESEQRWIVACLEGMTNTHLGEPIGFEGELSQALGRLHKLEADQEQPSQL